MHLYPDDNICSNPNETDACVYTYNLTYSNKYAYIMLPYKFQQVVCGTTKYTSLPMSSPLLSAQHLIATGGSNRAPRCCSPTTSSGSTLMLIRNPYCFYRGGKDGEWLTLCLFSAQSSSVWSTGGGITRLGHKNTHASCGCVWSLSSIGSIKQFKKVLGGLYLQLHPIIMKSIHCDTQRMRL